MLKRKVSRDGRVAQLSTPSALLYVLSIPWLDVEGRMDGHPVAVRGTVARAFAATQPDDWTDQRVAAYMAEWTGTHDETSGAVRALVAHYCIRGTWVCYFAGFRENQQLRRDRERPSSFPAPPESLLRDLGIVESAVSRDQLTLPDADSGRPPGPEVEVEVEVQAQELPEQRGLSRAREADREPSPAALQESTSSGTPRDGLEREIVQAVERRKQALSTHEPLARLLEVLPDADEQTPAVLHSVFDRLGQAAIEHARREVLEMAPRRPSAYALRIGQRLAGAERSS